MTIQPSEAARCRRILEVSAEATQEEIGQAYQLLRRIHGGEHGLAAAPAMDEFDPETRQAVLAEIEAAYEFLRALPQEPTGLAEVEEPETLPPGERTFLRQARDAAGLTLDQVAGETCVRREYLKALEEERFQDLRLAVVLVRGYLNAYVNAIGLVADEVVPPYMKKFQDWQGRKA